jgi:hypothetical protein
MLRLSITGIERKMKELLESDLRAFASSNIAEPHFVKEFFKIKPKIYLARAFQTLTYVFS